MLSLSHMQTSMPALAPVSVAEAKTFMRVGTDAHDGLIGDLIAAVVDFAESESRRSFIIRNMSAAFAGFPAERDSLVLPGYPVNDVTSITYLDFEGEVQTVAEDVYRVIAGDRGQVVIAFGKTWPRVANCISPVTVNFTAGYGDAASDVPARIKLLIRQCVADAYEHAEAQSEVSLAENMLNRNLFDSIRVPGVW